MKRGLLLLIFAFLCTFCTQKNELHITEISQKHINNAIIVDVRTPEEYEEGHLEQAVNINWFDSDFQQKVSNLDKDKKIFVYCKKGGRSTKAAAVLDSLGFDVVNLLGGYDAYTADN